MDIKHNTILGYWLIGNERRPILAYTFNNNSVLQIVTPYGNGVAVRSRNFIKLDNHNFEPVSDLKEADLAKFPASAADDLYGFAPPAGFVLPNGYGYVYGANGDKYIAPTQFITEEGTDTSNTTTTNTTGGVLSGVSRSTIFTDPIGWVKANPIWAIAGAVVIYMLFFQKKGKKKRGGFSLF